MGDQKLLAAIYAKVPGEVAQVVEYLMEEGFIRRKGSGNYVFTMKGLIHAESKLAEASSGVQGFVAMWFDDDMKAVYEAAIEPAISDAGYDPFRVDSHEHVNRIDDEIISQIRASRFLVADFTGHRGGVYFEAGYALGRGLPVIWTCRKNDLDQLHFDTRQYKFIDWENPEEFRERLRNRIGAIIGQGPH